MNIIKTPSLFLLSSLILTGCSGGGGGGGAPIPSLPAGSTVLSTANAESIATSAVAAQVQLHEIITAVETVQLPSVQSVVRYISDISFNRNKHAVNIVSGVTNANACPSGGDYSDTWTPTSTSYIGTITFTDCDYGGISLNGSSSYSYSWDNGTRDYNGSGSGSITTTIGSNSFTLILSYSDIGNLVSDAYAVDMDFSMSGSGIGFLYETTSPFTGISPSTPTSGAGIISGGNNTRIRITLINGGTQATVELDDGSGTFTAITASPFTI